MTAGPGASPPLRAPRAVPASRAFAWYGEAMRLWRASPGMFAVLAAISMGTELALHLLPAGGAIVAQFVLPLVECSLLYGSLAADRGDKPRLKHLVAVLGASRGAQAAVVVAGLAGFLAQVLVARALTDVDLLASGGLSDNLTPTDLVVIVSAGIVVSLPLGFVAPVALFDEPGFANAFRASVAAFTRNVAPLAVYALLSLGLFLFGIVTSGLGLLLVLPWLGASSYAAWKDVFGVASTSRP